jgi:hypothetical protein
VGCSGSSAQPLTWYAALVCRPVNCTCHAICKQQQDEQAAAAAAGMLSEHAWQCTWQMLDRSCSCDTSAAYKFASMLLPFNIKMKRAAARFDGDSCHQKGK